LTANSRLASLGEMAAGIAHEINNPLAIIMGSCNRLQKLQRLEKLSEEDILETTHEIAGTVKRISEIIMGLKIFSRDGSHDPMRSENLVTIVKNSLAFCFEKIKNNRIDLILPEFDSGEDLHVDCRSTEISQVIVNLLSNSHDAVLGTEKPWIKIDLRKGEDGVELSVTDSGSGISKEVLTKIMHPFFTTKPVGKGTGLGLSLSKGIVESHNGHFYVDQECENTRFVVRLPCSKNEGK